MTVRTLALLLLLPAMNGCSALVSEAIEDAGRTEPRTVSADALKLKRAFRSKDTLFLEVVYGDRQVRRLSASPNASPAFKPYPASHAFPSDAVPVALHSESCRAAECLTLSVHTLTHQQDGRARTVGRLPRVSWTVYAERTNASYAKQIALAVFGMPLAIAVDAAFIGLYLFVASGGC